MLGSRSKDEVNPSVRELQTGFSNMLALVTSRSSFRLSLGLINVWQSGKQTIEVAAADPKKLVSLFCTKQK